MYFQRPFLDSAEHLSEDVISVFPAAESLEQFIMALLTSVCHEENAEILLRKLNLYQVGGFISFRGHTIVFIGAERENLALTRKIESSVFYIYLCITTIVLYQHE